jgi:hypothetical protein
LQGKRVILPAYLITLYRYHYEREDSIQFIINPIYKLYWVRRLCNLLVYGNVKRDSIMKQYIDNIFTVSYMVFGLFLILVGVKDSNIYLFESIGLIIIGGGLTTCAINSLIDDMGM